MKKKYAKFNAFQTYTSRNTTGAGKTLLVDMEMPTKVQVIRY
jgi:hypothetical protein